MLERARSMLSAKPLIAIVFLLSVPLFSCRGPSVSVQELKEEIERELPKGTAISDVILFLDSRGISHSDYVEGRVFDLTTGDYVRQRLINASIPGVKRRLFVEYDIYLTFWFDESRRLIDYKAVMHRTDP